MFAIMNIKTNKFVYGTDYRYWPPQQRTSEDKLITFDTLEMANIAINRVRKCRENYRVVELEPIKVKRIIER